MAYFWETCFSVATMLCFGSLNTILLKVQMTQQAIGVNGQLKSFEKPWFVTLTMFSSMVLALILVARKKCKERSKSAMNASLLDESDVVKASAPTQQSGLSYQAKVRLVSIPAIFDLPFMGCF